jgi:murein DD-endopeptidase MepM/ murein hydrolase activator NlpD
MPRVRSRNPVRRFLRATLRLVRPRRGGKTSKAAKHHRTQASSPWAKGAVRILVALGVLASVDYYVFYHRRGTSVPEILRAAEVGRQASLLPGLSGPPGTLPKIVPKKGRPQSGVFRDYGRVSEVSIEREGPVGELLKRHGIAEKVASEIQTALQQSDGAQLMAGQRLTLCFDNEEQLQALDLMVSEDLWLRIDRAKAGGAVHWAVTQPEPLSKRRETVRLTLGRDGGLAEALAASDEHRALIPLLDQVFRYDLDLFAGGRAGDRLRLVIDKVYEGKALYRYGRVLAAAYESKEEKATLLAYYFVRKDGTAGYYSERGEGLKRDLLRSPFVPRLGLIHSERPTAHNDRQRGVHGVDLWAAQGTVVRALSAGSVVHKGPRPGLGLSVVLNGGNGEFTYGHLGHFARGLREGQTIAPGQTLGVLGAAEKGGRPHLHLGLRSLNRPQDPLKVHGTRSEKLSGEDLAAFRKVVERFQMDLGPGA